MRIWIRRGFFFAGPARSIEKRERINFSLGIDEKFVHLSLSVWLGELVRRNSANSIRFGFQFKCNDDSEQEEVAIVKFCLVEEGPIKRPTRTANKFVEK